VNGFADNVNSRGEVYFIWVGSGKKPSYWVKKSQAHQVFDEWWSGWVILIWNSYSGLNMKEITKDVSIIITILLMKMKLKPKMMGESTI
jgi:hypothetical protein